ncbi:hypothetical protein [Sulfurimonas sp.]|uniref:hypothetical protein n=1 Tax=Sulfurimonas sp. TaxID=2022749 RepID=UPI003D0CD256
MTREIENSFYNDRAIRHQLGVLNALGVKIQFHMGRTNNQPEIQILHIEFASAYLKEKSILNIPKIIFTNYQIESMELFQLEKPNKELLTQSAINGGFSPQFSNFELVVESIYNEALHDVKVQEKRLTQQFKTVLNQNLLFLQDAVNQFILFYKV